VVLLAKLVYATEATTAAPIEAPCFEGGEGVPQAFSSKDPCSYLKKTFWSSKSSTVVVDLHMLCEESSLPLLVEKQVTNSIFLPCSTYWRQLKNN
jgi:hypothetical protein